MLRRPPHPRPRRRRAPAYRRCPRYQEVSLPSRHLLFFACNLGIYYYLQFPSSSARRTFFPLSEVTIRTCATASYSHGNNLRSNWVYCLQISEIMYCRMMKLVPKNCSLPDVLVLCFPQVLNFTLEHFKIFLDPLDLMFGRAVRWLPPSAAR